MDQSNRTVLFGVLLTIIFVCIRPALCRECVYKFPWGHCTLSKIIIQNDEEATNFDFPDEKRIQMLAPTILQSWETLFKRIPYGVERLEIDDGIVPEVFIKNSLHEIKASKNLVREVIIDKRGPYELKSMEIFLNHLRFIPKNIGKLINLVTLDLHWNEIETVDMNEFKDLTLLKELTLYGNRITRIETSVPIRLPNLVFWDMGDNYLENMQVKLWDLPNLSEFYLHTNKLRKVQQFPERFPNLKKVSLALNRWNCKWLNMSALWTSKITVRQLSFTESCLESSVNGICCEDNISDVKNEVKFLIDQLLQMNDKIESISSKVVENRRLIEEDWKHVSSIYSLTKDKLKWVNEKWNENRVLNHDNVLPSYLEMFIKTSEKLQRAIDQIDNKVSKLNIEFKRSGLNKNKVLIEEDWKQVSLTKDKFKWMEGKLNEKRAFIDILIEDSHMEQLEDQE